METFGSAASKPAPFAEKEKRKECGTPRASIVHGFSPVPRGWIRHPPLIFAVIQWLIQARFADLRQ